ncbi:LysR family transcriptional regulator [Mesorhizobium sp. NPDC059054]|uniref:LysR family transcriptional regulator n=1 Tax=Mesorhizobium sp. NPDC059054 TaxID=3346711 RepID=UPI00367FF2D7
MITLKQLEALYWAATLGSFVLAAERLFMTQSALSKRILELEEQIGEPLFDRSGPRARITELGTRVLENASEMLNLRDAILLSARSGTTVKGVCRFGVTQIMAIKRLPELVVRIRDTYPEVKIEPQVALTQELLHSVSKGELDFALAPGPSIDSCIVSRSITAMELVWVCSPSLVSHDGPFDVSDFPKYPLISMSDRAGTSGVLSAWAIEKGVNFTRIVNTNSPEAAAALTIAGLGIALLAAPFVESYIQSDQLKRLPIPPELEVPPLNYFIHWRSDNARKLAEAVREIAIDMFAVS